MALSLPLGLRSAVALTDYTTWKVGGAADYFAEPESTDELLALLRWAAAQGCIQRVIEQAPTCWSAIKDWRDSPFAPATSKGLTWRPAAA